jgi:hypothetical protein
LAFLSGISEHPGKVTALCVEEHENGNSAVIRLASNTGIDKEAQQRFESLALALEKTARSCRCTSVF